MGGDDPSYEDQDSAPHDDASPETAFLREVAHCPELLPSRVPRVQPGDTIGRFRIDSFLGRGGTSTVYAAFDTMLERWVAIKLLDGGNRRVGDEEPRLLQEARAFARVNHPHLATLFDIGEADGRFFIAMELVRGHTLRTVMDRSPVSPPDAFHIARAIAHGLAAIHRAGLVHRDIKPENVMIGEDLGVKILDLGFATLSEVADAGGSGVSDESPSTARRAGTPRYMSPEQTRGLPVDARSDVFSLGAVLYEMLTGERPFRGDNLAELFRAISRETPPTLRGHLDEPWAPLAEIVDRCLQKDPHARYAHAADLATALDALRVDGIRGSQRATDPRVRDRSWRRSWMLVSLLSGAVLIVGLVVWRRYREAPRPSALGDLANSSANPSVTPRGGQRVGCMIDLPPPESTNPVALTAYQSAIRSFHDSNWGQAEISLREALRLDPALGVAHLRLSLILSYLDYTSPEARAAYREATRLRESLSVRDRGLLAALEPVLNADPVDLGATVLRLTELTERHPVDAELFNLLGIYRRWEGPAGQLEAAEHALLIDPEYPDAWAAVAEASAEKDPAASIAALDRCLAIAPTASDCRMTRAVLESALGRCDEAEHQIRMATDDPHASEYMFLLRARFLFALGASREAVVDAFRQRWARLTESSAREDALYDAAVVAAGFGDFETAKSKAEDGLALVAAQATLRAHVRFFLLLMEIALESGDAKAARAVASSFLARKSAWQRGLLTDDPTVYLTRIVARGGEISGDEMRARRQSWYESAMNSVRPKRTFERSIWRLAYAQGIERLDEALEALAVRPQEGALFDETFDASLGRVFWLAGQPQSALPYLARAHHRCDRLASIMSAVPADLLYGDALEKEGDRVGACETYDAILLRWGNAKPRSVTAEAARGRWASLGCRRKSR